MKEPLLSAALKARRHAYAPYSNHRVGAAVLAASGNIYSSGNVENCCYALTICAERGALYHAIAAGEHHFKAIAVTNGSAELVVPCGVCRQVIWELAGDIPITMFTAKSPNKTKVSTCSTTSRPGKALSGRRSNSRLVSNKARRNRTVQLSLLYPAPYKKASKRRLMKHRMKKA